MKKNFISLLFSAILIAGCGSRAPEQPDLNATVVNMAQSTLTAVAAKQAAPVPDTATPTEVISSAAVTDTPLPAVVAPTTTSPPANNSAPCLAAQLTDETYADGTYITPGVTFTQSWVLRNVGSCAWTDEYSFILHHGFQGTPERVAVGYVEPGTATTLTVTFVAPNAGDTETAISSFWSIQSPDGTLFGASGYQYFWVNVNVAGATPTSKGRDLLGSGSSYRSNGSTSSSIIVGDTGNNYSSEAFLSFNFGNIPADAVITAGFLDIFSSTTINGDPFVDLGCLRIAERDSDTTLWLMCSKGEMQGAGSTSADAISYIQSALSANEVFNLVLTFATANNDDNHADHLELFYPILTVEWYKP